MGEDSFSIKSHKRNVIKDFVLQSKVEDHVDYGGEKTEQEVVTFNDIDEQTIDYAAIYDSVASGIYTKNYELGDFLGRPTRLYHFDITPGSPFSVSNLNPWADFCNNDRIKYKLHNYSYIQMKLKIKVVVNSTPFVYGLFGLSYQPLPNFTPIVSNDLPICLSQRKSLWLDFSKSCGGTMELPFFWYENFLPLDTLTSVSQIGTLKLWQVVQAAVANSGVTNKPSITIYAWAEDVRLCGNTVNLSIQSEETSGPISKVASTISSAASYFESIPIIGRFAKATTIGATAVGAIASMFGWTNLPVVDDAKPLKSMAFHGLASAHISNVVDKLTLDPANELTISPTTVGLPADDELAIANLVQRSAILAIPVWATTAATTSLLFAANVNPSHCQLTTGSNQTILYDTPMAMVSRAFSSWKGDIIYHVKIIKTPYHRGRLIINYDPSGDIIANADNNNVVQTVIIDIAETDEFKLRIPYMAPQSFQVCQDTAVPDYAINGGSINTYSNIFHNGRLTIRVLNPLTAPLDTASVSLVISVSGAENLEFANPSEVFFTNNGGSQPKAFTIQSGEDEIPTFIMGDSQSTPNHVYDVNMGERIASLREVLRRSTFVNTERITDTTASTGGAFYNFIHTKYPQAPGYDPNGIHGALQINGAGTDAPYNFTQYIPFHLLASCFVGMRGSTMWHYNVHAPNIASRMLVHRQYDDTFNGTPVTGRNSLRNITYNFVTTSFSNTARFMSGRARAGAGGLSLTNQLTQSGLSVLYPQYNRFRFVTANPANYTFGSAIDDSIKEKFCLQIILPGNNANLTAYDRYFSIGPDFNFFYFVNVPPRYIHAVPTAATF